MCGIWALIHKNAVNYYEYNNYYEYFMKIKHRGPDISSYLTIKNVNIGFHRLSIIEKSFLGNQPFIYDNSMLICNGEIYNYKELIDKYNLDKDIKCDCLVLLHLYKKLHIEDFINVLKFDIKAEYAFMIFDFDKDNNLKKLIVSRDHVGVRPLFYSYYNDNMVLSSELKGIPETFLENVREFPCGELYIKDFINNSIEYINYTTIYDIKEVDNDLNILIDDIKINFIKSVNRRLLVDDNVEIGYYLSGGLDSSLVCAIAAKLQPHKKIKTFSIGFKDSTDLPYAKKVAEYINSDHTEVIIDDNIDIINLINDIIYVTCTYDITTIRASVGQYLLSKYIKENTNIRVILNGDGSDEVLGGYLFNFYAPDSISFNNSCKEYVKNIHLYDSRRLDRCLAFFSLEARVPFLDIDFIKSVWRIPARYRMPTYQGIEKFLLRKAFEGYLDNECLYRKKEAFSDGITDKKNSLYLRIEKELDYFPLYESCLTKESSYYKYIFTKFFNGKCYHIIPHYWKHNFIKNDDNKYIDPSARCLDVY